MAPRASSAPPLALSSSALSPSLAPPSVRASEPAAADAGAGPSFAELEQRLRNAGWASLADILGVRVTQTRRKMKLTEEEARRAAQEVLDELPTLPNARQLLAVMPRATIELVRSIRERGVPREEAERMAVYLLELRSALAMDNEAPFDENCSHVVGREWQDIDYRDEGMTWERQKAIYLPKGIPNFKTVANLQQFFRVESKAPYFQKVYGVKGSVP